MEGVSRPWLDPLHLIKPPGGPMRLPFIIASRRRLRRPVGRRASHAAARDPLPGHVPTRRQAARIRGTRPRTGSATDHERRACSNAVHAPHPGRRGVRPIPAARQRRPPPREGKPVPGPWHGSGLAHKHGRRARRSLRRSHDGAVRSALGKVMPACGPTIGAAAKRSIVRGCSAAASSDSLAAAL